MIVGTDAWTRRYAFHLESIPELLVTAREGLVPLQAARYDGAKVDGGGQEGFVPFRADAMDDADLLWALLIIYGQHVAYLVGGASPGALRGRVWTVDEPQGIPASLSIAEAASAAHSVTSWLVKNAAVIGPHLELEHSEEQLFTLVRQLRGKYGMGEGVKRSRARTCQSCGERTVVAVYAQVGGKEATLVRCTDCGAEDEEAVGDGDDATADVLAGGQEGEAVSEDDPPVETRGNADVH